MKEMTARLTQAAPLTMRLFAATVCVNVLSFASPLFVMLILGQYTNTGFDGTLVTFAVGMVLAMALQVAFKQVRTAMAAAVSEAPDERLAAGVADVLTRARMGALWRVPEALRRSIPAHLDAVRKAYSATSITSVLDAPFCLAFIAAAWWLSPWVGAVALVGAAALLGQGLAATRAQQRTMREAQREDMTLRGMVESAQRGADTVRLFGGGVFVQERCARQGATVRGLNMAVERMRLGGMNAAMTIPVLARVAVYAVGAKEVVVGNLTVAGLIAANILVSRAFMVVAQFVGTGMRLARGRQALRDIRELSRVPLEAGSGTALREFSGRLSLRDVAFAYPGSSAPLFESLTVSLSPGTVAVVHGPSGAGKTTFARLLTGLVVPTRGDVLADGITLRQLAPAWWRAQVVYVPQEPTFVSGTLRENITLMRPDMDDEAVAEVVRLCGLTALVADLPQGLQTPLTRAGRTLSYGIRRRVALARAVTTQGRLVVMDDPFEGLDEDGVHVVSAVLRDCARQGRTIIVCADAPDVLTDAHVRLDLGRKPEPEIVWAASPGRQRTKEQSA